jgi:hypothetical protein
MATPVVGITGDVTLPTGFNILVKSGSLALDMTLIDTTNTKTSNGNFEGVTGVRKGAGTAIGIPQNNGSGTAPGFANIPTGNNIQLPAAATFKLASGCTYTGSVVITSIKTGFVYQGSAALSMAFTFSGSIVESWS